MVPGTIFENNFDLKGKKMFFLSAAFPFFLMGSSLLFCLNAVFYFCYSRRGPAAGRAPASATLARLRGPGVGYEHTQEEEVLPCFVPIFLK